MGKVFVQEVILNVPDQAEDPFKLLIPSPKACSAFLNDNDLVVTATDKNLGIAVSKQTWLNKKWLDLLLDKNNYTQIHYMVMKQEMDRKCTKAEMLAIKAENILPNGKQIGKFSWHLITENDKLHRLPHFYGIPKIHKKPVKMRPIIPCHSTVHNPATKYVDKCLRLIVQSAVSIIHASKDLVIKLSKLNIDTRRRYYIITGDVVAFYPNIPIQECIDITLELYEEYIRALGNLVDNIHSINDVNKYKQLLSFTECLHLGNTKLIFQYNEKFYLQKRGLAIGISSSPTLANLLGWYYERKVNILNHPNIIFYGRYIDDCLTIVHAASEEDALHIVSKVIISSCTIEWNCSLKSQPFLDILINKDEDNELQHKPFRKASSHQERIPWISHHPLDVKRGTCIGEMSRLAMLSSQVSDYKDSMQSLAALYIMLGYPSDLVFHWLKDNITE